MPLLGLTNGSLLYLFIDHLPTIVGAITAIVSILVYFNGKNNNAVSQLLSRLQGAEVQARADQRRADDALTENSVLRAEIARKENEIAMTLKDTEMSVRIKENELEIIKLSHKNEVDRLMALISKT